MESPIYQTAGRTIDVIETLGFFPKDGFVRLALHIDRCEGTCAKLGYPFDRGAVLQALGEAVGDVPLRVRLTVGASGQIAVETGPMPPAADQWSVALSDTRLDADDPWLGVKTTNRALYDTERAALGAGIDEMIYLNQRGEICEGTITTIFVFDGSGYLTPALACGCLPGVLRQDMLDGGQAREAVLQPANLKDGFYVGNSLRGLIHARLTER